VTFTEFGLFIAVFLAVTREGEPMLLTLLEMALFLAGLAFTAYHLGRLYALTDHSAKEIVRRYRLAWRTFAVANASVPVYLAVWWIVLFVRAVH